MAFIKELRAIADDTTGALDLASSLGGEPPRRVHFGHSPRIPTASYIIDTNSRYLSPSDNGRMLVRYMKQLEGSPPNFFKIDSTLRGNAPAIVQWLAENTNQPIVCVPMFPQQQRTCVGGIYFVDGVPITETEYARDQNFQLVTPDIRNIAPNTIHTTLEMVREGRLAKLGRSDRVFTFDAVTGQDMVDIVTSVSRQIENPIYVGSAALAQTIAEASPNTPPIHRTENPIFCVGSQSSRSREQVQHMLKNTPCERGGVAVAANDKQHGLVYQTPSTPMSQTEIARFVTETAHAILDRYDPEMLFVTGGATALEFLHVFGVRDMTVTGRLFGGVAQGKDDSGRFYFTKPGGFGGVDTLTHLYNYVTS